ncbi:MAG: hypothetical protein ACYYK0_03745 [Candidatus Eutrophobiaceae bacterium]
MRDATTMKIAASTPLQATLLAALLCMADMGRSASNEPVRPYGTEQAKINSPPLPICPPRSFLGWNAGTRNFQCVTSADCASSYVLAFQYGRFQCRKIPEKKVTPPRPSLTRSPIICKRRHSTHVLLCCVAFYAVTHIGGPNDCRAPYSAGPGYLCDPRKSHCLIPQGYRRSYYCGITCQLYKGGHGTPRFWN